MFGLMRKKTHKRILADVKLPETLRIQHLVDSHETEIDRLKLRYIASVASSKDMEYNCMSMMNMMRKRHTAELESLLSRVKFYQGKK